jgi:hypothetical protein
MKWKWMKIFMYNDDYVLEFTLLQLSVKSYTYFNVVFSFVHTLL